MPRWAKILLKLLAVLAVVIVAVLGAGFWLLTHPPLNSEKLGGAWELRKPNSLTIGSGMPASYLQRVHGKMRTTVAERPYPYRYLGDDCMVFTVWIHGEFEVRAACGDRPPILVSRVEKSVNSQDLSSDPIRVNGASYSWDAIKRHALLGQPF